MAPDPQCAALANAQRKSGKSYSTIAKNIGKSEQHVIDICTGARKPTAQEFNAIATELGVAPGSAPHDSAHSTV